MYRYWARLSLGAAVSAALVVVGFASMSGLAYADHVVEHALENLKGGLGALEQRVWDCEQGIGGVCPGTTGPQGPQGDTGTTGPQGAQGPQGPSGDGGLDLSGIQARIDSLALLASRRASVFIFVTSTTPTS